MLFAAIINDRIDLVKVNTTHNMNSTIDLKGYYIDTSTLQYRIMKDISLGVPGKGSIKGNKYGEVPDFHTHELFGSLLANIVLKNTLVKAATQTQTISRDFFSTENVIKTSRTSEKNRQSTCTADLDEPSILFGTFLPGSKPHDAVTNNFALLSSILLASSLEANPPNTTE